MWWGKSLRSQLKQQVYQAEADMGVFEREAVTPKTGASSLHGKQVQHLLEQK